MLFATQQIYSSKSKTYICFYTNVCDVCECACVNVLLSYSHCLTAAANNELDFALVLWLRAVKLLTPSDRFVCSGLL